MAERKVSVDIVGNAKGFQNAARDATGSARDMGGSIKGALAVAGAATLAVGAIAAVGTVVFTTGAQMEAMDDKAKTVFGDSLGMVQKWSKENAAAMGLTAREATNAAAGMADLLVPMGFTREQAAAMSTDVMGLSGALSEWSGGTRSATEVSEILQKALLGERDGLKALGISISEADVQAQLAKNGTEGLTGAALQQAKALATQELIMAKSTDAQAAFAAGGESGMRSQAELGAQLNEVKETLITALYPVLKTVAKFLAENLPGAIKVVGGVFSWLSTHVFPPVGAAIGVIIAAIEAYIGVVQGIMRVVGPVLGAMGRAFRGVGDVIGAVFGAIGGVIRTAINGVIGIVNGIIGAINRIQVHIDVGPVQLHWNGLNLGYIPRMHTGGIVPGAPGSEVLTILQAGERVSPANEANRPPESRGDVIVNVTVQGDLKADDEDSLAKAIARTLWASGIPDRALTG